MSALENIRQNSPIEAEPAEQAGIFLGRAVLSRTYELFTEGSNQVAEAAMKTQTLEKTGRYIRTIVLGNAVMIEALADEQGKF